MNQTFHTHRYPSFHASTKLQRCTSINMGTAERKAILKILTERAKLWLRATEIISRIGKIHVRVQKQPVQPMLFIISILSFHIEKHNLLLKRVLEIKLNICYENYISMAANKLQLNFRIFREEIPQLVGAATDSFGFNKTSKN